MYNKALPSLRAHGGLNRGLSETTVKHVRATLSGALRAAQLDHGLPRNAASLAKMPKSEAKVALEALSGHRTVTEIAQHYRVHPNQVCTWERQAVAHMEDGFNDRRRRKVADDDALKDELYQQVGRLNGGLFP